jgi:polysaccharide pyruvyl transferase WcaK-like protein
MQTLRNKRNKKRRWVHESTDQNQKTFFVGLSVNIHNDRTRRQTFNKTAMHRTAQSQRGETSFQLLLNSGKLHDPRVKGG